MRNVTAEPIILDVSVIVYSRSPSTIKTQLVPRRCYKQCFQVPLIISCILDTVTTTLGDQILPELLNALLIKDLLVSLLISDIMNISNIYIHMNTFCISEDGFKN